MAQKTGPLLQTGLVGAFFKKKHVLQIFLNDPPGSGWLCFIEWSQFDLKRADARGPSLPFVSVNKVMHPDKHFASTINVADWKNRFFRPDQGLHESVSDPGVPGIGRLTVHRLRL